MHIEPGITSEPEVKFVHDFLTTPQKLVLLVASDVIRVLLSSCYYEK